MAVRVKIIAALASTAFAVGLGAAAPADAAASGGTALGVQYAYNSHARLGSFENPIIMGGSQNLAILTQAQRKSMDEAKVALAEEAKNGTLKAQAAVRPDSTGCVDGAYWSECNSSDIGWIDLATTLNSSYHEEAEQSGQGNSSDVFETYIDQSTNGGFTWTKQSNSVVMNSSMWGPEIYDGPGYYDRGCIYDTATSMVYCDAWH